MSATATAPAPSSNGHTKMDLVAMREQETGKAVEPASNEIVKRTLERMKRSNETRWKRGQFGGLTLAPMGNVSGSDWVRFYQLNNAWGGIDHGCHLIGGDTNMGKSSVARMIAYDIMRFNKNAHVRFYTLDDAEDYFFDCVSGETLVHTREGLIPAQDLAGKTVDVLSEGGVYRPAVWTSRGVRQLCEIRLANGDVLVSTENHEWPVPDGQGGTRKIRTKHLTGQRLIIEKLAAREQDDPTEFRSGVQHGLIYGDGSISHRGKTYERSYIHQYDDSKHLIEEWFDKVSYHKYREETIPYAGSLPAELKNDLPSLERHRSYLRGFIAGLIASDGCVSQQGSITISQKDEATLQYVKQLANHLGLAVSSVATLERKSGYSSDRQDFSVLTFFKSSFDETLILKNSHKEKWAAAKKSSARQTVEVVEVVKTDRIEEVYCCVEPETHTFVIENMYLTGNCFVAQAARVPINAVNKPEGFINRPEGYYKKADYERMVARGDEMYQRFLKGEFAERFSYAGTASMKTTDWDIIEKDIKWTQKQLPAGTELVIFIDNFHDVEMPGFENDNNRKTEEIANRCGQLCEKLGITMIGTVELKKNNQRRPTIDDIFGSRKWKYKARTIILVYSEIGAQKPNPRIYYDRPDKPDEQSSVLEVHIAKSKGNEFKGRLFYEQITEMGLLIEVPKERAAQYALSIS